MPKAAKVAKGGGSAPAKPAAKKKNGYSKSEKIPLGEILSDISGQGWRIGPSIGSGGFGDIYCACRAEAAAKKDAKDYDCVIKIEPHGNGPLFVEMHFYMRNARLEDINKFCAQHKIKTLGMPHIIGSGSHMLNGEKHRFLVIPRYGKDIWSFFLSNKKRLPEHTVYRLAIQMLDVYQFIHGSTYVHADLKGANILLDYTGKNPGQAFLVDFGLACHYTTSDYKPDPRKMHNGTIEYTSRDAHNGVPTRRGDFEILGYNLVHWLGVELPWETQKLLANPQKVQKAKEEFMKDVSGGLNKLFSKSPPSPVKQFLEYVQSMEYNQAPDYDKCKKFFQAGLKSLHKSNSGPLEMLLDKSPLTVKSRQKRPVANVESESDDNDDDDAVKLRSVGTPKRQRAGDSDPKSPSDPKPNMSRTTRSQVLSSPRNESFSHSRHITPKLNLSGVNSAPSSAPQRRGKTVINDDITPNPKSKKTYEFNFELDVSLDANVIVNVKRKKKAPTSSNSPLTTSSTSKSDDRKENGKSDKTQADSESVVPPSPHDSPVPRVSVRKVRTVPQSPAGNARATCRRLK